MDDKPPANLTSVGFSSSLGRWAYMLAPQLTGRAQKAFAAMGEDQAGNYDALKKAILKRYNVNEEAYWQRLRGVVRRSHESYRELATRVRELTQKWLAEYKTIDEVVEAVATEQLLEVLSEDVRVYVREHKPKTCTDAGELAEDYLQARSKGKVLGDGFEERQTFCKCSTDEVFFLWADGTQVV